MESDAGGEAHSPSTQVRKFSEVEDGDMRHQRRREGRKELEMSTQPTTRSAMLITASCCCSIGGTGPVEETSASMIWA